MAALDVVFDRLVAAELGDYCLEVHSSKTSKTQVLQSLKGRLELQNRLPPPGTFTSKLEELRSVRDKLNEYARAVNKKIGSLGLTVQQVLWGEQRERINAGDAWEIVRDARIEAVLELTPAQRNAAQHALNDALSRIPNLVAFGNDLRGHPWAWVGNHQLSPFDQQEAHDLVARWRNALWALVQLSAEFRDRFGAIPRDTVAALTQLAQTISQLTPPSEPAVAVMARAMSDERARSSASELMRNVTATAVEANGADTVVLAELPTVATDWEEWYREVDGALLTLGQSAAEAECLDDAAQALPALRADAARLARIMELARTVQESAGLNSEVTVDFATIALRAAHTLSSASREVLIRRQASLFDDGAEALLSRAATKAEQLSSQRRSLGEVFVLDPFPSLEEVDRHGRALRAAGPLGAISRSVMDAKRFFRSIAVPGFRAKTPAITQYLTQLGAHLYARRGLEQDPGLAQLCGRWFEGPDTRFDLLQEVHQFGHKVRADFQVSDGNAAAVRTLLLEGSREILEKIGGQFNNFELQSEHVWLKGLADGHVALADLLLEKREKISAVENSINRLIRAGIKPISPFSALAKVAQEIGSLNQFRLDVAEDVPQYLNRLVPLSLIADAFELAIQLGALDLPAETLAPILSGDAVGNFAELGSWATRVGIALDHEAAERRRVTDLLHVVEEDFSGAQGFEAAELDTQTTKLDNALSHQSQLGSWAEFLRAKKQAADHGLGGFVEVMAQRQTPAQEGVAAYSALVYRLLARAGYERFPQINEFDGLSLEQARERFRRLDREILELQRMKIRSDLCHVRIPAGVGAGLKREFTNLALIRAEMAKRKRHIPLRDLFHRAAEAIQQMKPCLMMSPLSVAAYLKPGSMTFDLIVIDEASQMPPEDAVGALLRSSQCVVVGDRQQLPPTSFFRRFEDAMDAEDEEESEDVEIESILDQAHNVFLPPRQLRWHYRSRHQSLIAFSNKQFYDNGLTVFPSPIEEHENFGVRLVQVSGQYVDRHNPAEAKAIAGWVVNFMAARADRSLGIVAVNQLQRDLIYDEMERLFERDRRASAYRQRWEGTLNHFFVKNLENVQGDERDVIAISTVYGPNADGRVIQNFGPISQRNGHRRLNVLFTRAREQVVIFSSLRPEDIEIRDTTAQGPRVMRNYLDYALTKRLDPGRDSGRLPESDFEVAVATRLTRLGYEAVPQVGVAGFFIDLAVRHPEFPGTFLIGIECDGATYHSAKSARDRDRLREEVLTDLGWTIYRIWSTDWFRNPDGETEKLRLFIEQAASDRRTRLSASAALKPVSATEEGYAVDHEATVEDESSLDEAQVDELALEADHRMFTSLGRFASDEGDGDERSFEATKEAPESDDDKVDIDDIVTFHFADDPDNSRTVTIIRGEADVRVGAVSAHSPVGEAFLGAAVGDDVDIYGPQGARTAIIERLVKAEPLPSPGPQGDDDDDDPGPKPGGVRVGQAFRNAGDSISPSTKLTQPLTASSNATSYRRWTPRALPDPRSTGTAQVAHHLREIIEVEGPIRVQRAYRLYAQACGINRIGRVVRSALNKALYRLVRQGEVISEPEGADGSQIAAVVRITGEQRVIIRTTGGREFWEVPPSEIAAVMGIEAAKSFADEQDLYHRVLSHYGVVRLTSRIYAELNRINRGLGIIDGRQAATSLGAPRSLSA